MITKITAYIISEISGWMNNKKQHIIIHKIGFFFIICTLFMLACNSSDNTERKEFLQIKGLLYSNHYKALKFINSINVEELSKKDYNEYILLKTAVNIESGKTPAQNRLILNVVNYFDKQNNPENAALANYYCGVILYNSGDYQRSMAFSLNAEQFAAKTSNTILKGEIQFLKGFAIFNQDEQKDAIPYLKKSIEYFNHTTDRHGLAFSYSILGGAYTPINKDSACFYYNKAFNLAEQYNLNPWFKQGVMASLGTIYLQKGKLNLAKVYYRKSFNYPTNDLELSRTYLYMSDLYTEKNKIDSASFYISKAMAIQKKQKNKLIVLQIYESLSKIEDKKGNTRKSYNYYKQYTDGLLNFENNAQNKSVLAVQARYNTELAKHENTLMKLKYQRIVSFMLLGLLIISLLALWLYRRSSTHKKNELEAENKVLSLQKMAQTFDEKEQSFRNVLLRQFDILKKATLLDVYVTDSEREKNSVLLRKFNEIVYGQGNLNWNLLYETMNEVYNGLFERLKEHCPELNETEFKICCLTYAQFSSTEVSVLMNLSVNTVQMKRSSIRKKLGIEPLGNIQAFLDQHFGNKEV
jgi:tetratricopeptide (TPR) repeat protein